MFFCFFPNVAAVLQECWGKVGGLFTISLLEEVYFEYESLKIGE